MSVLIPENIKEYGEKNVRYNFFRGF